MMYANIVMLVGNFTYRRNMVSCMFVLFVFRRQEHPPLIVSMFVILVIICLLIIPLSLSLQWLPINIILFWLSKL
jgi:hypothetical protein